jgi:hypothetical protein
MYASVFGYMQRVEVCTEARGVKHPAAGIIGSCEPHNMDISKKKKRKTTKKQLMFFKNSVHS